MRNIIILSLLLNLLPISICFARDITHTHSLTALLNSNINPEQIIEEINNQLDFLNNTILVNQNTFMLENQNTTTVNDNEDYIPFSQQSSEYSSPTNSQLSLVSLPEATPFDREE